MKLMKQCLAHLFHLPAVLSFTLCLLLSGCGIAQKDTASEPHENGPHKDPVVKLLPENEYTINDTIPHLYPPTGATPDTPPVAVEQIHVKQCRLYKNLDEAGLDLTDKTKYHYESPLTKHMPSNSTREDQFRKLLEYPLVLITLDIEKNELDDDMKKLYDDFDVSDMALVGVNANKEELGSYRLANYNSDPILKEKEFFHVELSPGMKKELTIGYFIDPEQTPAETLMLVLNPIADPAFTTYAPLGLTTDGTP